MKNKFNWKCRKCTNNKIHSSTPKHTSGSCGGETSSELEVQKPEIHRSQTTPVDHEDYVTQRKKKAPIDNFTHSAVGSSSSSLSETNISNPYKSLPDLSTLQNTDYESLKREIHDLKMALQSTENEMDNIILEKVELQKKISEQDRKIQYLLQVCENPKNNPTMTKTARKRKRRSANKLNKTKDEYNLSPRTMGISTVNINDDESPINESSSQGVTKEGSMQQQQIHDRNSQNRKSIYILADEQGQGLREALRKQIDHNYDIFSFWKRGADLVQVINTCKSSVAHLTKQDYLIIVGGKNDKNLFYLKSKLLEWLSTITNTNVIVCGLPANAYLNNISVNFELELICQGFAHCSFVKMYYRKSKCETKFFIQNLCFALTRDLYHLLHRRGQTGDLLCNCTQIPPSIYTKRQGFPQENPHKFPNADPFFINDSETLLIMHQNIAGLLNKKERLEIAVHDTCSDLTEPINIICMTETFVPRGHESNIICTH